jgi:hypothetical protein
MCVATAAASGVIDTTPPSDSEGEADSSNLAVPPSIRPRGPDEGVAHCGPGVRCLTMMRSRTHKTIDAASDHARSVLDAPAGPLPTTRRWQRVASRAG